MTVNEKKCIQVKIFTTEEKLNKYLLKIPERDFLDIKTEYVADSVQYVLMYSKPFLKAEKELA